MTIKDFRTWLQIVRDKLEATRMSEDILVNSSYYRELVAKIEAFNEVIEISNLIEEKEP